VIVTEAWPRKVEEGLGVDAGGDHQRGEGVAALVEPDRLEAGLAPVAGRPLGERLIRERATVRTTEDEAAAAAAGETVLEQVLPERGGHRDRAPAGAALRRDRACHGIPPPLDPDHIGVEVDGLQAWAR
jgi:hypothetical protein